MAETKRTEFEAERDRIEISEMYLHGMDQQSIANRLNQTYYPDRPLSQQQISYDIRLLISRWVKTSTNHIDQKKAIELAKIDDLEITYREAWERSKQNAEIEVTEQIGSRRKAKQGEEPTDAIQPERIKKYKRVEGQSGNPAFLNGIQWCISKRCEILGIEAAKKLDVTTNGESIKQNDDAGRDRAITAFADALREALHSPDTKPAGAVDAAVKASGSSPAQSSG